MSEPRSDPLVGLQLQILRDLATGAPPFDVLDQLCRLVEEAVPDSICSLMVLDDDGMLRLAVAPSIPRKVWPLLDGLEPGPFNGSCGRAAFTGESVYVEDTATDPAWEGIRHLADELGIHACWSRPIRSRGEIVGTFAISHSVNRMPNPDQVTLLETATHLAGIALETRRTQRSQLALEEQLHQAQKMEVIGQLVGGITHDMNNLVTVIIGGADALAFADRSKDPEASRTLAIEQIRTAGQRAASLTQQLLATTRRQTVQSAWIDLAASVEELSALLHRLVPEHIHWSTEVPEDIPPVFADPSQLQMVLLNLAVNGADAMPDGGELSIRLSSEDDGSEHGQVLLEVRDSGTGIPENIRQHIFEPFFTTKPAGKGTGLGLASARSTTERLGGTIECESEPGKGSVFRVRLPSGERQEIPSSPEEEEVISTGFERVLICEDEGLVRNMLCQALQQAGYTVYEAGSAEEAQRVVESFSEPLDLLVSDMVLPGRNGVQLLEALRVQYPDLPCIFVSGYEMESITEAEIENMAARLLPKPFAPSQLLQEIDAMLTAQS